MQQDAEHADNHEAPTTLAGDTSGSTTLEWALLLCVIAIPSYWLVKVGLQLLTDHYRMMTTLNSLPFP